MAEPEQCADIYVQPGESHLVRRPAILRTLLGSCVGVTFRHEELGIAALCHPMLPRHPAAARGRLSVASALRYVDFAIRDLAAQFDALGARRWDVEIKLFGGADVLLVREDESRPTVGRLNRERALEVLRAEGFEVAASRLGGQRGYHIDFNTATGEVWLRLLQ
ncbi:MAG: chemotaxis protein CheD [Acidobacteriaceae bacterium]|jgi:chemotaxis protein CheD